MVAEALVLSGDLILASEFAFPEERPV